MRRVAGPVFTVLMLYAAAAMPAAAAGPLPPVPGFHSEMTLNDFLLVDEDGHRGRGRGADDRRERWEDRRERAEQMPPEQREEALRRLEEMEEKRRHIRQELESLPPEERKARMEDLREELHEKHEERREYFREKFQEKWNSASPDERAEFCANARQRCAEGGNSACEFASKSCGG